MSDPKVRELLLAKVDDLTGRMAAQIEEVRTVTEQLAPERPGRVGTPSPCAA
jgi:hypothetical protein